MLGNPLPHDFAKPIEHRSFVLRPSNRGPFIQLLISCGVLTALAFISERSHVLASVVSVMPMNITFALWFISTRSDSSAARSADFGRMVTFGLFPTMLFTLVCWFGFRRDRPFGRTVVFGYAIWLVAMGIYRGIEWWLQTAR